MNKIKNDTLFCALILILGGAVIALFPSFLSKVFAIIGAAVVIYNIIRIVLVFTGGGSSVTAIKSFFGIFLGIMIFILPTLIEFSIPVIVGVIICSAAVKRILLAVELKQRSSSWIPSLVIGIILAAAGLIFIFNPFAVSTLFKRIIGIVLIASGILWLLSDYNKGHTAGNSSIIDIDSYTVHDDNKFLK